MDCVDGNLYVHLHSFIAFYREGIRILPQEIRVFFVEPVHGRHAGPPPQSVSQRVHLLGAANGINFHAPVEQIPYKSADTQIRSRSFREKAEPYPLHSSGYKESFGLCFHGYTLRKDLSLQPRDCSKGPAPAGWNLSGGRFSQTAEKLQNCHPEGRVCPRDLLFS